MGSVSISTGRVSTVKSGDAVRSPKAPRGQRSKKAVDIEALAHSASLHIMSLLDDPEGKYQGKLTCEKGTFKRWVLKNMPACDAKPYQRDRVAQRVIGMLLEGGTQLGRLLHSTGGRHDFYEVTQMGRVFLRDPEEYEAMRTDKQRRARAMHPSTGVVRTLGKKAEVAA